MRKTILMLINGFGVERKDSTEVYSPKLMPNLDTLSRTCLFGSLVAEAGDYNTGYKNFSIPSKKKNVEDEIDDLVFEKKLGSIPNLKAMMQSITNDNTIHVFFITETGEEFNKVREFAKIINANKDKKLFIHMVLTSTSVASYQNIGKAFDKISFETGSYCKVGMVVGANKINSVEVLRAFYREQGEHWNESHKKLDLLQKNIVIPEDAGVFIINTGFALKENDTVFFMNFQDVVLDKFYADFSKVKVNIYSLYEFKENIPSMLKKPLSEAAAFSELLEKYDIKSLVLTSNERLNDVNYYLNGMKKKLSKNIKFALNDNNLFNSKESVIKLVEEAEENAFIIDYDIGKYSKMDDIKGILSQIDGIIKFISEASKEKEYTFIISSLYGMHASVMDGVVPKVVNFEGKVPCIFQNNEFNKSAYVLNAGNIYSLMLTFLTNVNDNVKSNRLVHKMSPLEKMLAKK